MVMKKIILILSCFLFYLGSYAQTPANDPLHWIQQWKDDFRSTVKKHYDLANPSGLTIDKTPDGWNISRTTSPFTRYWDIDHSDHGGEPQAYRPENITFDTEGLVFTTKKEEYNCGDCSYPQHHYTSGAIGSNINTQNVLYGYIEARIKLIDTYGLFPAFWTWVQTGNVPTDYNWDYDEIDIFEMAPGTKVSCAGDPFDGIRYTKNYTTNNIHTDENGPEESCGTFESNRGKKYYLANNGYVGWHYYGVEWSPSKIIYYFDGYPIRVAPNPGYVYPNVPGKITQETNIILNQAMAGYVAWDYLAKGTNGIFNPSLPNYADYFDGKIDAVNYYSGPHDINTNPSLMKIEYVAYYKLNADCPPPPLTITSGNINDADSQVKWSITTSGTINLPTSKIWRAADNILINGDFTVPGGTALYLDVNPCYY